MDDNATSYTLPIKKFDGTPAMWQEWHRDARAFLIMKGFGDGLEEGVGGLTTNLNRRLFHTLWLMIDGEASYIRSLLEDCDGDGEAAWISLSEEFDKNTNRNKAGIFMDILRLELKACKNVIDFFNKIKSYVRRLDKYDVHLDDCILCAKLAMEIDKGGESYSNYRTVLTVCEARGKETYDDAVKALTEYCRNHEEDSPSNTIGDAMSADSRFSNEFCTSCRQRGHFDESSCG